MDSSNAERQKKDPFFWAAVGPVFLTCALSALLFQVSFLVWPLVALACSGLLLTWWLGNRGFVLSFVMLIALMIWKFSFVREQLWCSLFLGSMVVSWFMVFQGRKEVRAQGVKDIEIDRAIEEKRMNHEQELIALKRALQNALGELAKIQEGVESAKSEAQVWIDRCEELTHEVSLLQTREKEMECALEQAQSAKSIVPVNSIVSQESVEEMGEMIPKDLLEMQMKYRQLQGQFQEKIEVLTQSRKELFNREGELILLQKEQQEQSALILQQDVQFHKHLGALEQECRELELQVVQLEQVISSLLAPKKQVRPRVSKGKKKDSLTSVIKGAIEKKQIPQQISLLDS